LPSGCILVRCTLDHSKQVVTADTRLKSHMKITAVIAPEADNALESFAAAARRRRKIFTA
jgi:hypothetical protein